MTLVAPLNPLRLRRAVSVVILTLSMLLDPFQTVSRAADWNQWGVLLNAIWRPPNVDYPSISSRESVAVIDWGSIPNRCKMCAG